MSTTIKVYDEALHRQVEEYMAAHKLSQEQMGVKLGRSGAAINQYLSRKYKGSVENLEKAFREFLAQEGEAVATQKQAEPYKLDEGYKPTSISEDVYQCIRFPNQPHAGDAARRRRSRQNEGCRQVLPG